MSGSVNDDSQFMRQERNNFLNKFSGKREAPAQGLNVENLNVASGRSLTGAQPEAKLPRDHSPDMLSMLNELKGPSQTDGYVSGLNSMKFSKQHDGVAQKINNSSSA